MSARSLVPLLLILGGPLAAQDLGRGNVGVHGKEPRLTLRSAAPRGSLRFRVTDLAPPQGKAQLLLLLSGAPAEIPLDGLGVRGAVLGLDPATLLLVGPLPVDAQGSADWTWNVDPAWRGIPLFVQALYVDARLAPPFVFSDSRSMTIGSPDPELVLAADGTSAGTIGLVRLFPDGAPATPLPRLGAVALLDLDLASLDENRTFRDDLPRPIRLGGKRAVRLVDGSTLVLVAPSSQRAALLRIHRSGRVERVFEAAAGNLAPILAASPTHVAFTRVVPSQLWLYRTDESNWPGTAEPARDVTPASGLAIEPGALVFGARVLCYVDNSRGPFLIPLDGSRTIVPKLPPSGGRPPAVFDEEVAVSGDGRSFAFGAGPGKKQKDIYVVRDDGQAVNVTKRVTDYAEVGYQNPGRRIELRLNADGTLVSYVDEGGKEPENFVTKVPLLQTVHITTSQAFVDSIDIGATTRFPTKGQGGLIVAGIDAASLDLFFSPSISDKDVIPLTNTAGATQAPFGRNAKLSLLDLGSLAGSHPYLLHAKHQARATPELWVIDTFRRTARIAAQAFAGRGAALPAGRLLVEDGPVVALVDPNDASSGFVKRIGLGSGSVRDLSVDASANQAAVVAGAGTALDLWLVDTVQASARKASSTASALGPVLAGHLPGEVHLLSAPGANGRGLLRYTSVNGLKSVGGSRLQFFFQAR